MSTQLAPVEFAKDLAVPTPQNINKAHRLAKESAETAVQYAIRCGELLIAKQAEMQHGEFHAWIEENCSFALSTAKRYVIAAKQQATGIAFSSLRQCFPSGRPQPQQEPAEAPKPETATAVAAEPEPPPAGAEEGAEPDAGEEARLNEYYASLERAAGSDAQTEIKRMSDELSTVKASRDGFMNEKTAAVSHAKKLQRTNDRLERENASLKAKVEKLQRENAELRKAIKGGA